MKKRIAVLLILLAAFVLNADLFNMHGWLSKEKNLQKGEVTIFALNTIESRYLDKSKIKISDLLTCALDAVQDSLPETIMSYDKAKKVINLQIYNQTHEIKVRRMRDVTDVAYALKSVYTYLDKEYVPEPPLTKADIEYIAINGILKKLDPHSYIFTPKDFEDFENSTGGNFGGLGIVVGMNDNGEITVISPMKGTPATKAGIEANDVIVQIDDISAVNLTLDKAVSIMRGEPGTPITLMVRREGVPDLIKFEITRAIIKITSVLSAMPQPGIGYINLSGFMENTYSTLIEELDGLKAKGMKALVLDMRNNSGGLLSQAIDISDIFLDRGTIVSTVEEDGEIETNSARKSSDDILDIPVIVMINEGSASATEIVTAALKKNNRATVIGRKSFGKGSVQTIIGTPGGGGIKLTIAQYLTPGNISIQSVGITPDIEVRPVYIHPDKISVFDSGENILKEGDLEEHIVSKYAPKTAEVPQMTIRYFKEYKDIQTIIKERRAQRDDEFRSDEEIDIAVKIANEMISSGAKASDASSKIKDAEWNKILGKLGENNINWKERTSIQPPKTSSLKVTMLEGSKLKGGETVKFTFKAEIEGEIENLLGVFETPIANLRRIEVPFGTFSGSVERTVSVKLPESMQWQKTEGTMKLYLDEPKKNKEIKSEKFMVEVLPVQQPDLKFDLKITDSGNHDGIIQSGESAEITVGITNAGKGPILEGKALLINSNDSKEIFIEKGTNAFTLEPGKSTTAVFTLKTEMPAAKKGKAPVEQKLTVSIYDYKNKYNAEFVIPVENPESKAAPKPQPKSPISMPKLVFANDPLTTDNNKTDISFEIDTNEVRDAFVFLNNKKVFYQRFEKSGEHKTLTVPVTMTKKYNRIFVLVKNYDSGSANSSKYVTFTKGEEKKSEDDFDE